MRCLKSSEIKKWLAGQGMHHHPLDCGVPVAGEYLMPVERRAKLALADQLADLLAKDGSKLVEVIPSRGCDALEGELLVSYRARFEEERPLAEVPGHLFKSREAGDFRSLLSLIFGFDAGWSLYIYAAPSRTTLCVSERIDIWSPKRGLRNELGRRLPASRAA